MTISAKDKRTIRFAAIGLGIYLLAYFGFAGFQRLEKSRADFKLLVQKLEREQLDARRQENDLLHFKKLSAAYRLDPRQLPKEKLIADASAAIQNAARQGGFALTSMRETAGRTSSRELSAFQIDGMGPAQAGLNLVHTLLTLGYPVVIDSLQFSQEANKPGMLKVNMTLVILDFEQWQKGPGPNA